MKFTLRVLNFIKPYKGLAALTLGAAIVTTLMDLVPPWLIKVVIDDGIRAGRNDLILLLTFAMVAAYAVKAFSSAARIRLNNAFEQKVIYDIRNTVYRATQRLSISYFENRSTGEIMSRINNDVENMERIVESGTHEELIRSNGAYATLFEAQLQL